MAKKKRKATIIPIPAAVHAKTLKAIKSLAAMDAEDKAKAAGKIKKQSIGSRPAENVFEWRDAIRSPRPNGPKKTTTRQFLTYLSTRMTSQGPNFNCFLKTITMAKELATSERYICNHIKIAIDEGWLKKTRKGTGKNWARYSYFPLIPNDCATEHGSVAKPDATERGSVANPNGTERGSVARAESLAVSEFFAGKQHYDKFGKQAFMQFAKEHNWPQDEINRIINPFTGSKNTH